ncbi:hypothetical protein [Hippea maritima]|uniref:Uncharacterized protein n=1 Tax=Hippea maritima (strain ATCC 700847 / DSM 10411 / MH2) TaxID=760142 RepID=F2LV42_HIPMA|nr:hypothetical protein [Hippea maritima]AEA33626.1 hypothetical protein Hipma_0656 [Hippea maritima DSM 10411]
MMKIMDYGDVNARLEKKNEEMIFKDILAEIIGAFVLGLFVIFTLMIF